MKTETKTVVNVGSRFGSLTVQHLLPRVFGVRLTAHTICDCGVEKDVRADNLQSGRVVGCGSCAPKPATVKQLAEKVAQLAQAAPAISADPDAVAQLTGKVDRLTSKIDQLADRLKAAEEAAGHLHQAEHTIEQLQAAQAKLAEAAKVANRTTAKILDRVEALEGELTLPQRIKLCWTPEQVRVRLEELAVLPFEQRTPLAREEFVACLVVNGRSLTPEHPSFDKAQFVHRHEEFMELRRRHTDLCVIQRNYHHDPAKL